jgi:AcrR family transcriptional regulator
MASRQATRRARGRPRLSDVASIDDALLAVALKEFLENGYGGASLSQIVEAAGVSKTTLYSRFSSKAELFRAVIRKQIDKLAASVVLQGGPSAMDIEAGLEAYANRALDFSLRGDELAVNRLIYSESHRFPELGATAAERTRLGIASVSRFIRERSRAEGFACKDPDTAAEAFILMLRGWYVDVMLTNAQVSPQRRKRWVKNAVRALVSSWRDW